MLQYLLPEFNPLSPEEKKILLRAPALVSVFSVSFDTEGGGKQKVDAIKLAHLKTFFHQHGIFCCYKGNYHND
jgi:hypothetical protein